MHAGIATTRGPWLVGLVVALAAHAGVLVLVLGRQPERTPLPAPPPVFEVALATLEAPEAPRPEPPRPPAPPPRVVPPTPPRAAPAPAIVPARLPREALPAPEPAPMAPPVPVDTIEPVAPAQAAADPVPEAQDRAADPAPAPTPAPPAPRAAPTRQERSYFAVISAHLNRRKTYPAEARQARQQGVVVVRFRIDRAGNVLSADIKRGSGHAVLDEATLDLLRRVSPLPRMPRSIDRDQLTLSLPIDYALTTD